MSINIKKIILSTIVGFLLLSAISLDVSAAKKSSKLSVIFCVFNMKTSYIDMCF